MTTGELLDRTFGLYRHNFVLFAGIILPAPIISLIVRLVQLSYLKPILTAQAGGAPAAIRPELMLHNVNRIMWSSFGGFVAWMIGLTITYAATVRAVSAVHLSKPITIGESYAALRGKLLRILAIALCLLVAVFALTFILSLGVVLIVAGSSAAVSAIGTPIAMILDVAAGVGALWFMLAFVSRYSLAVQSCIVEGTKVFASFKRSVLLTKGRRLRILAVYLLFLVMNLAIGFTLGLLVSPLSVPFHSLQFTQLLGAVAGFIAGVVTGPLITVALSLVYYDERVRKEGYDLQLMMAALDEPQTQVAATAS